MRQHFNESPDYCCKMDLHTIERSFGLAPPQATWLITLPQKLSRPNTMRVTRIYGASEKLGVNNGIVIVVSGYMRKVEIKILIIEVISKFKKALKH